MSAHFPKRLSLRNGAGRTVQYLLGGQEHSTLDIAHGTRELHPTWNISAARKLLRDAGIGSITVRESDPTPDGKRVFVCRLQGDANRIRAMLNGSQP